MRRTTYILAVLIIGLCAGCGPKIDYRNKLLTVGRVDMKSYAGKNGRTNFYYVMNGRIYAGTSHFDNREFAHGDMIVLYVDKTDPHNSDVPSPRIKLLPMNEGDDSICMAGLGINLADYRLMVNCDMEESE